MSARRLPWLLAYDVRSPRRLARLHRYLSKHAAPVQYSVFIGRYTPEELNWLCEGILAIIDSRQDDVRCYPLPDEPCLTMVGQHRCPPGWSLVATLSECPEAVPGIRDPRKARSSKCHVQPADSKRESDPVRSEPTP